MSCFFILLPDEEVSSIDVVSIEEDANLAVLVWVGPVLGSGISKAWAGAQPFLTCSRMLFLSLSSVAQMALSYRLGMTLPGFQCPSVVRSSSENSSCLAQVANHVRALWSFKSLGKPRSNSKRVSAAWITPLEPRLFMSTPQSVWKWGKRYRYLLAFSGLTFSQYFRSGFTQAPFERKPALGDAHAKSSPFWVLLAY